MSGSNIDQSEEGSPHYSNSPKRYPIPDYNGFEQPFTSPKARIRDSVVSTYSGKVESAQHARGDNRPTKVAVRRNYKEDTESDTSSIEIGKIPTSKGGMKRRSDYNFSTIVNSTVPSRSARRPASEIPTNKMKEELRRELAKDNPKRLSFSDRDSGKPKRHSIKDELDDLMQDARSFGEEKDSVRSAKPLHQNSVRTPKAHRDSIKSNDYQDNSRSTPFSVDKSGQFSKDSKTHTIFSESNDVNHGIKKRLSQEIEKTSEKYRGYQGDDRFQSENMSENLSSINSIQPETKLRYAHLMRNESNNTSNEIFKTHSNDSVDHSHYSENSAAAINNSTYNYNSDRVNDLAVTNPDQQNESLPEETNIRPKSPVSQPLPKQSNLPPRPTKESIYRAREVSNATRAQSDHFGIEEISNFDDTSIKGKDVIIDTTSKNEQLLDDNEDDYVDIDVSENLNTVTSKNKKDKKKKARKSKAELELKPFSYNTLVNLLESMNGTVIGDEFSQLNLPIKEKQLIEKIIDSLSRLSSNMVIDSSRYEIGIDRMEKALRALEGFI